MNTFLKTGLSIVGGLAVLAAIGWLGLQIPPRIVSPVTGKSQVLGDVRIPENLPAPVLRYLHVALGDRAPRIESAVFWGRAQANFGVWMPMRFQLYHRLGYDFRRDMQMTWFGFPVLKALDQYVNGQGMTGLVGKADTGTRVDQGSNMILFAEAPLYPSIFVTDSRIRWVAIDETSAQMFFPFGAEEDSMTVYFDPQTALITKMTALRYFGANGEKEPWRVDFLTWQQVDDMTIPARSAITWEKQGKPWSYWDITGVAWNVDLSAMLTATLSTQPVKETP
ncbi:MAG: hypothetical protein NT075_27500 [Chloroflexi bacterium]|nr:hypothetical protein [Chloroflexota bacterium]